MTDNERDELIFDIASHKMKSVSQAGIHAMAISYTINIIKGANYSDERLKMMLPEEKPKKSRTKSKSKGF